MINWNQIAELGLLERINKQIMHPLGLAVCRVVEDGDSPGALVAEDQQFNYDPNKPTKDVLTDEQIKSEIKRMQGIGA